MTRLGLGPTGIAVNITADGRHLEDARVLEQLGYRTLWLPGGQLDRLGHVADLLGVTTAARVATGIVSPDVYGPDEVARQYADLESAAPGRFVVGLGGSQRRPLLRDLHAYLDGLDRASVPVPAERRILAALGPRKLEIARDRCAGAITLLVTPDHTSVARSILGADATLVVDEFVVLDTNAAHARRLARVPLGFLATIAGYRSNFARMGFTDDDIGGLSDRLVDELVAWGDVDAIVERLDAHRAAGADHIVLSVLNDDDQSSRLEVTRRLAYRLNAAIDGATQ